LAFPDRLIAPSANTLSAIFAGLIENYDECFKGLIEHVRNDLGTIGGLVKTLSDKCEEYRREAEQLKVDRECNLATIKEFENKIRGIDEAYQQRVDAGKEMGQKWKGKYLAAVQPANEEMRKYWEASGCASQERQKYLESKQMYLERIARLAENHEVTMTSFRLRSRR
jgi:hypothetical protein